MPEAPARLWLNQARSDFRAASRLLNLEDHDTYCQVIAKYQQTVEKSVKAIAAALSIKIGYFHGVERIVKALVLMPRGSGPTDINRQVKTLLDGSRRAEIGTLGTLAPRQASPGELAHRNTEYPFQRPDGSWIAPCDEGAFDPADVNRFRGLADRVLDGAARIVQALERSRRPSP